MDKSLKCVHDLTSVDSTLELVGKKAMVVPTRVDCVCKCCGKLMRFEKDEDGFHLSKMMFT